MTAHASATTLPRLCHTSLHSHLCMLTCCPCSHVYAHMQGCTRMHARTHARTHACAHACTHVCMHACACAYACMQPQQAMCHGSKTEMQPGNDETQHQPGGPARDTHSCRDTPRQVQALDALLLRRAWLDEFGSNANSGAAPPSSASQH